MDRIVLDESFYRYELGDLLVDVCGYPSAARLARGLGEACVYVPPGPRTSTSRSYACDSFTDISVSDTAKSRGICKRLKYEGQTKAEARDAVLVSGSVVVVVLVVVDVVEVLLFGE